MGRQNPKAGRPNAGGRTPWASLCPCAAAACPQHRCLCTTPLLRLRATRARSVLASNTLVARDTRADRVATPSSPPSCAAPQQHTPRVSHLCLQVFTMSFLKMQTLVDCGLGPKYEAVETDRGLLRESARCSPPGDHPQHPRLSVRSLNPARMLFRWQALANTKAVGTASRRKPC